MHRELRKDLLCSAAQLLCKIARPPQPPSSHLSADDLPLRTDVPPDAAPNVAEAAASSQLAANPVPLQDLSVQPSQILALAEGQSAMPGEQATLSASMDPEPSSALPPIQTALAAPSDGQKLGPTHMALALLSLTEHLQVKAAVRVAYQGSSEHFVLFWTGINFRPWKI